MAFERAVGLSIADVLSRAPILNTRNPDKVRSASDDDLERWIRNRERQRKEYFDQLSKHNRELVIEKNQSLVQRSKAKKSRTHFQHHLGRVMQREWAKKRNLRMDRQLSIKEVSELQQWFSTLDSDGSGEIGVEELADPLLTTGLANNEDEVNHLFETIDADGSGEIDFAEFLQVITGSNTGSNGRATSSTSQSEDGDGGNLNKMKGILSMLENLSENKDTAMTVSTAVGVERRKILLEAVTLMSDSKARAKSDQHKVQVLEGKFNAFRKYIFGDESTTLE